MELIIREMKLEDWEAVSFIYKEGINTKIATFQSTVPLYEEWDHEHIKKCRLVAAVGGKIVGWTALSNYSSRLVYSGVAEVSIYIEEASRGKHIGEKLLYELIAKSEMEGYWTLQSGIIESNKASLALHERAGFRVVGFREKIARNMEGEWTNTVLMERRSKIAGVSL